MVISDINLANTMGGKTARACDNCITKRARWYCPADDAFLCQGCDSSVHSANPLALRHERVRLKTAASMKKLMQQQQPSWDRGFTKKARTTRRRSYKKHALIKATDLVPEICSDDNSNEEENDLVYRVPIFDPSKEAVDTSPENNYGSLQSELEMEEFAADVESLLGKGLDDESFDIEGLGFSNFIDDHRDHDDQILEYSYGTSGQMKVEDHHHDAVDHNDKMCEMGRFDIKNLQSGQICKTEVEESGSPKSKKICLRLDYEGVLTAWSDQRSPWATGERPKLDPNDCCWPVCMGSCGRVHSYGEIGKYGHPSVDGGREARVSRYREKRRTRLFTKKIRYEVRKLNAEKRPRMKGRFVKRPDNLSASLHSHIK